MTFLLKIIRFESFRSNSNPLSSKFKKRRKKKYFCINVFLRKFDFKYIKTDKQNNKNNLLMREIINMMKTIIRTMRIKQITSFNFRDKFLTIVLFNLHRIIRCNFNLINQNMVNKNLNRILKKLNAKKLKTIIN